MSARKESTGDFLGRILGDTIHETSARLTQSLDAWTNPTPPRFRSVVPSLWAGSSDAGKSLCNGAFMIGHQTRSIQGGNPWKSSNLEPVWQNYINSFTFLGDLRAVGGDAARREARHYVSLFLQQPVLIADSKNTPKITAKRLIAWLTHFDFYGESATYEFQLEVRRALNLQIKSLMKADIQDGMDGLYQACALWLAGIAMDGMSAPRTLGQVWLDNVIRVFIVDGGMGTRRPSDAQDALSVLVKLNCTLLQNKLTVPEFLTNAIGNLAAGLRAVRVNGQKLPVFQGGYSGNTADMNAVLKRANTRNRHKGDVVMGYQKLAQGRTNILIDAGAAPAVEFDETAHAAPLAFNLWVGKDHVVTQCGNSPFLPESAQLALRGTAAHSTVTINDRNISEIRAVGGLGRRYPEPQLKTWDVKDGIMVDAFHNGYQSLFGITHQRKIALLEDGEYCAGEDQLCSETELLRSHQVAVRFHLHPRVTASLIQNDTEVLLRLPSAGGWRFVADGQKLSLDETLYCGSGHPHTSLCITMTREMEAPKLIIPWAFQAELPS